MAFSNNILNTTGTLDVTRGGTSISSTPSNGQLLIGDGTKYVAANLTAGSNITITNAAGSCTIASTAGTYTSGDVSFLAYFAANASYGANATLTGWTETFDTANNFNNTTGVFTAPYAGIYSFHGCITMTPLATQNVFSPFIANNVSSSAFQVTIASYRAYAFRDQNTNYVTWSVGGLIKLAANDVVTLNFDTDNNNTKTFIGNSTDYYTWFSGILLAKL